MDERPLITRVRDRRCAADDHSLCGSLWPGVLVAELEGPEDGPYQLDADWFVRTVWHR